MPVFKFFVEVLISLNYFHFGKCPRRDSQYFEKRRGMKGKTVKLKLRDSDFETYTRQVTLTESIQLSSEISEAALELLKVELSGASKFRLVGVGISGFRSLENQEDEVQLKLKGL